MPHSPQCMVVLSGSTHAPPQFIVPAAHMFEQWPSLHTAPAGHLLVQDPQRSGSLETSTQVPSHSFSAVWHITSQLPATHEGMPPDWLHFCPQAPQLSGSSAKLTQIVPHGE